MAKKQLEDDLLTGGSLNADDKSAKKSAEKKAAKAAKNRENNEAKRAEIKKEIDALKAKKDDCDDEKEIEKLSGEIKKLSEKYSAVGANSNGLAPKTIKIIKSAVCIVVVVPKFHIDKAQKHRGVARKCCHNDLLIVILRGEMLRAVLF